MTKGTYEGGRIQKEMRNFSHYPNKTGKVLHKARAKSLEIEKPAPKGHPSDPKVRLQFSL